MDVDVDVDVVVVVVLTLDVDLHHQPRAHGTRAATRRRCRRRVARWDPAAAQWTYFVTGPQGEPLEELVRPASAAGTWVAKRGYAWLGWLPLAQLEYGAAGAPRVFAVHADHLATPRALTNPGGAVVWSAAASPYGEVAETMAADPETGATVVTNLRLPGQYDERLLGSIGLQGPYYNWNRWYLPSLGRYLELDPIALQAGLNGRGAPDWYNYALGSPNRDVDPDGEAAVIVIPPILWAIGAGIAAWETYVAMCTAAGTCPWSPTKCDSVP